MLLSLMIACAVVAVLLLAMGAFDDLHDLWAHPDCGLILIIAPPKTILGFISLSPDRDRSPKPSGKRRLCASIPPSTLARSLTSRLLSTYSIVRMPFLDRTKSSFQIAKA
jgi:hypothetical protein